MKIATSFAPLSVSLLLATQVAAQVASPPWAPEVRGGPAGPLDSIVQATVDAESGVVTRVRRFDANQVAALGAAPCFDNSRRTLDLPDGQYIVSNTGEELLCWGVKNCGGASRLRRVTIQYGTSALDPSLGGPGAAFSFAVYSGTTGWGVFGTEIFRQTFVGLPGRLFGSAGASTYVDLEIDFTRAPLPLADAAFGWGFLQLDGQTGPVSVVAPRRLLGTVNAMDIYGPGPASSGTYVGTFNFGGPCDVGGRVCANMYLKLDEIAVDELASTRVLNGSGTNPLILHELFRARLGHIWAAWIDAQDPSGGGSLPTLLMVTAAARSPLATPNGELLVALGQRLIPPMPGRGGYSQVIPADHALAGVEIFVQGVVLPTASTPTQLTNALAIRIGY